MAARPLSDPAEARVPTGTYDHLPDVENRINRLIAERLAGYLLPGAVLSLGYAHDSWADVAIAAGCSIHIVEGNEQHVTAARRRYLGKPVTVFHSMFADFQPQARYSTVIAGNVIELFEDPAGFFALVRRFGGGRAIITTPNSLSLHRRVGEYLAIDRAGTTNESSGRTGAQCIYTLPQLAQVTRDNGFAIVAADAVFLKPLSNAQMIDWDDSLLRAFMRAGEDVSAELRKHLFVVAETQ